MSKPPIERVYDAIMAALQGRDEVRLGSMGLGDAAGVPKGSVGYHVSRLAAAGRITIQTQGRGSNTVFGRPGSALVGNYTGPEFKGSVFWTEERVVEARRLFVEVGLSASKIAKRMGTTRNTIIGKSNRMGWVAERGSSVPSFNVRRAARAMSAPRPKAPPKPKPERLDRPEVPRAEPGRLRTIPLICEPVSLLALSGRQCRYPVSGEGADTLFCGAHTMAVYCPAHARIAFNGIPERKAPTTPLPKGVAA